MIKCEVCGKFIGYAELENNLAYIEFTPDTQFTSEKSIAFHTKCKPKQNELFKYCGSTPYINWNHLVSGFNWPSYNDDFMCDYHYDYEGGCKVCNGGTMHDKDTCPKCEAYKNHVRLHGYGEFEEPPANKPLFTDKRTKKQPMSIILRDHESGDMDTLEIETRNINYKINLFR